VFRWWLSRNAYERRKPEVPVVENDGAYLSDYEPGATATWIGHASFAVHEGDSVFLTDPHFGQRALIPARLKPPGVPIEAIPPDAFAVISHNHYDHLDQYTVETLPDSVTWYVPLGFARWFEKRDRAAVELDWWESAKHGEWTITCLPSQHWTRRLGQGENELLWCSWLVDSGKRKYYFAGDTGYFHGFAEIGRRYGPIDLALLPIGAYSPRWFMRSQHLDPAEAYQAYLDLGARAMLGMHWGTFDLTDEPLDQPPIEFDEVVRERGGDPTRARSLAIGERFVLDAGPRVPPPSELSAGAAAD
jgi:N-acyl-phosphatidylethanolamine-hydrolysing phospholipase D